MLEDNINKTPGQGDGSNKEWPYTFPILTDDGSDIVVYITDSNGNTVTLDSFSNYTVDVETKKVTYPVVGDPLSSSYKITLVREVEVTQKADLKNQNFDMEGIEKALDKLTAIQQQHEERINRSFKAPINSTGAELTLPEPSPGKALGWNPDGSGFMNYDNPGAAQLAAEQAANIAIENANLVDKHASVICKENFMKGTNVFFDNYFTPDSMTADLIYKMIAAGINFVLLPITINIDTSHNSGSNQNNYLNIMDDLNKIQSLTTRLITAGLSVGVKMMVQRETPSSPTLYFDNYLNLIKQILDINPNIEFITVLNEFPELTNDPNLRTYWVELITSIREYRENIKISTSSFVLNDYIKGGSQIIDLIDFIGFNFYPDVSSNAVPTIQEVGLGIRKSNVGLGTFYEAPDIIANICRTYNKPFIITEYGCNPFEYQAMNPGIYDPYSGPLNYQVEANFLQGGARFIPLLPFCQGLFFWAACPGVPYDWLGNDAVYNAIKSEWGE